MPTSPNYRAALGAWRAFSFSRCAPARHALPFTLADLPAHANRGSSYLSFRALWRLLRSSSAAVRASVFVLWRLLTRTRARFKCCATRLPPNFSAARHPSYVFPTWFRFLRRFLVGAFAFSPLSLIRICFGFSTLRSAATEDGRISDLQLERLASSFSSFPSVKIRPAAAGSVSIRG